MRKLIKRLAIISMILLVVTVVAYQLLPTSAEGRIAVTELAKVHTFSLGPVGYAARIPKSEEYFFTILASRHSSRLFRDLFEQGTPEAKVYALAGLHLTDRLSFRTCASRFTQVPTRVNTLSGCMGNEATAVEAVAAVEQGLAENYKELRLRRNH